MVNYSANLPNNKHGNKNNPKYSDSELEVNYDEVEYFKNKVKDLLLKLKFIIIESQSR